MRSLDEMQLKPGRELDALVAEKVMGEKIQNGLVVTIRKVGITSVSVSPPPPYSTDIAAAWTVVDKLCSSFYMRWDDSDCSWQVSLDQKRKLQEDCRGHGYADSAPHAICLAALATLDR